MKLHLLVAIVFLGAAGVSLPVPAQGQNTSASTAQTTSDLRQWMLSYKGKTTNQLYWDKRFAPFFRQNLPSIQVPAIVDGPSLYNAARAYLGGPPNEVLVDSNRYLSASACVAGYCEAEGLLWVDLGEQGPLVVFAAFIDSEDDFDHDNLLVSTLCIVSKTAFAPQTLPSPCWRRSGDG